MLSPSIWMSNSVLSRLLASCSRDPRWPVFIIIFVGVFAFVFVFLHGGRARACMHACTTHHDVNAPRYTNSSEGQQAVRQSASAARVCRRRSSSSLSFVVRRRHRRLNNNNIHAPPRARVRMFVSLLLRFVVLLLCLLLDFAHAPKMASISSMKIVDGACNLASSNSTRTSFSESPRNLLTIVDAEMLKNVVLHSAATALASIVLPVPGGP